MWVVKKLKKTGGGTRVADVIEPTMVFSAKNSILSIAKTLATY
jgi:hypothetical protein